MMAGGARVLVRNGQLRLRLLAPIPAMHKGFPLHPDDPNDPYVFRVDLSGMGMTSVRLVFDCKADPGRRSIHTDLGGQPISLMDRPTFPRLRGALTKGEAELPQ